jgi:AcrR family transcriptional regulator
MPQRYRLVSHDWESSVNLTDRAEADRSVKYRRTMPTDAHPTSRVRAADELKQAALEQFATVGFAATSLQHIADHAGYSKSSVLYHYASKEALLEAAIEPAIAEFEAVLEDFLAGGRGGRSGRRQRLVGRIVDLLLENRQAVHVFIIQGPSLSELPIIARANAAVRRLAEAISEERESVTDQVRFGVALGGAAFLLTAGRAFADDSQLPIDDELRASLHAVLGELLAPADRRTAPITD